MDTTLVLGVVVLAAWLGTVYLRIPPAVMFLSILVGKLFSEELSDEVYNFSINLLPALEGRYVQLTLLLLPVILTVLLMKGTTARSRMLLNGLPLFFCLLTLALFVNPYFNVVDNLEESQRILLTQNESYIVAIGALITLISAWAPHMKMPLKGKKHKN